MADHEEPPALRHVVVPIDGSPESARALPLASHLGRMLDVPLSIVSVITDFRSEAGDRVAALEDILDTLPAFVDCRIVQSPATSHAITEESEDGIVCMATSGRLFDDDGIHGSTVEFVTAAATCPVVVVGPHCAENPTIERVVVAIDPSHDQHGLVTWAMRLGYHLGVPLDYVHVDPDNLDPDNLDPDNVDPDNVDPDNADRPLGPRVRHVALDPGETVAHRLGREAEGALLAMGSHGRTGFARLVEGSVAAALLPVVAQPVMILGPRIAI